MAELHVEIPLLREASGAFQSEFVTTVVVLDFHGGICHGKADGCVMTDPVMLMPKWVII